MSELGGRLEASRFVAALFGLAPAGSLVEVRFRVPAGMGQRFFSAEKPRLVVAALLSLASRTDLFVGVLPRVRRGGGLRDVVQRSGVLWADCDTSESASTFGCGRGGSVYDLASLLWQREPRGSDFVELRRELETLLLVG